MLKSTINFIILMVFDWSLSGTSLPVLDEDLHAPSLNDAGIFIISTFGKAMRLVDFGRVKFSVRARMR